ncbi:MAG: hypothetical protein ABIG71_01720 [Candidatus Uhrbacteria bacterium]
MRKRAGFSLLETVVAIGVIVTGLFAVFTLVLSNLNIAEEARFRFGAVQAAREGVEVVRMIRDANWVATSHGQPEYLDLDDETMHSAVLEFDPAGAQWSVLEGPFTLDDLEARIVQEAGAAGTHWTQGKTDTLTREERTSYRRVVYIYPICSDRSVVREEGSGCGDGGLEPIGIQVRSVVRWSNAGRDQELVVEEQLFDWR